MNYDYTTFDEKTKQAAIDNYGVLEHSFAFHDKGDLRQRFDNAGGWRGMFNTFSAEYKFVDNRIKVALLREILKVNGLTIGVIIQAVDDYWRQTGRPDIANSLVEGAFDMLTKIIKEDSPPR